MVQTRASGSFPNREVLISLLLVIPMFTHWLLPAGLERKFMLFAGFGLFYLPNICYFIYIILYSVLHINVVYTKNQKYTIFLICICLFLFSILQLVSAPDVIGEDISFIIFNNFSFIYLPLLFFCFPLDYEHLNSLRFFFLVVWFIICVEVLLYSVGLSFWGPDMTEGMTMDYAGVYRVHTTVGASTGTSIIVYVLGILLTSFFQFEKKTTFIILIITSIAVLFSVSRGSILVWGIYVCILFYKDYFKQTKSLRKVLYILIAVLSVLALYKYHFFDPLITRNELKEKNDLTSGRIDYDKAVFKIAKESSYLGVGSGEVYPDKSIIDVININHYAPVHNLYLLYLAEIGIMGCIFLFFIFFIALKGLDYSRTSTWLLWGVLGISCNIEMIFAWAEFMPLLLFFILCCKKNRSRIIVN